MNLSCQLSAKLNWTLEVLGKRADGFHELRSWFLALDWGDVLAFEILGPEQKSHLSLSGKHCQGVPSDLRNLLLRAEQSWRIAGGQAPTVHWQLEKKVPAGAGLGGGSSDAAGALRILQSIASVPLSETDCLQVAQSLGSDIGFFFQQGRAELRGGRGEVVLAQNEPPAVWLVLALTGLHASTPDVFAQLNASPLPEFHSSGSKDDAEHKFPPQPTQNQLESAALECVQGLNGISSQLQKFGSFTMSGSGSTFFSALPEQEQARQLAEEISDVVPEVVVCQPRLKSQPIPSSR